MKLKYKNTTQNPRALQYKRFIGIEKSLNLNTIYVTTSNGYYWTFDVVTQEFSRLTITNLSTTPKYVQIANSSSVLQYLSNYYRFNGTEWQKTNNLGTWGDDITLLSATFNNIGKYQTNKYYYVGSFDFMIKGSIEGTTTQYIKGNIIPLTSINIKHYNDYINLAPDDLVVVDGHLYSVENPETSKKLQPKAYNVYFATLNSIL